MGASAMGLAPAAATLRPSGKLADCGGDSLTAGEECRGE